jgi:hypothetical protein
LLLLTPIAYGQTEKPSSSDIKIQQCTGSPFLDELYGGKGVAVLKAYGYDLHTPWNCTTIDSPWTSGSSLLHFQIVTAEDDEFTSFSVINVNGSSYFWVLPTGTGMLEVSHMDGDPHNIAAFNALLSNLAKRPSSLADCDTLEGLYMVLIDHKGAVAMRPAHGSSDPCDADGDCTLAFSYPHNKTEAYRQWTVTFKAPSRQDACHLVEVSNKVIEPPTKRPR